MKKIALSALTALLFIQITPWSLFAQNSSCDSITNLGAADGKKLRLSPIERKHFDADKRNNNSDLFKPGKGFVSDTSLLKDSAYVKAFRVAAYEKAVHSRTTGHYVLFGGIIAVSAFILTTVVIVISHLHFIRA
jgi:hypothetical protein